MKGVKEAVPVGSGDQGRCYHMRPQAAGGTEFRGSLEPRDEQTLATLGRESGMIDRVNRGSKKEEEIRTETPNNRDADELKH